MNNIMKKIVANCLNCKKEIRMDSNLLSSDTRLECLHCHCMQSAKDLSWMPIETLLNDKKRLYLLVRQMRHELLEEDLITEEEFAELAATSASFK